MNHERILLSAADWINHPAREREEREPGSVTVLVQVVQDGNGSSEPSLDSGVLKHLRASPSHSCGSISSGHQVLVPEMGTASFSWR